MEKNNQSSFIRPSNRVVVVGAGMVGSTAAYALLMEEVARHILLVDIAEDLAKAHVLDLQDAATFSRGIDVQFGSYEDLQDGDIVVITAGAAQKEGQTRMDLIGINKAIMSKIFGSINAQNKQLYVMMVTNPVDVLTYQAVKELDQPTNRIFGSGTTLDTARLRAGLAQVARMNPHNIHANILGEHGDTSFPAVSSATAGGIKLQDVPGISADALNNLKEMVRDRAYRIIEGKKSTYFGIGAAVANICKAIIRNENKFFTLSVLQQGYYGLSDVCLGIPVQVGEHGYNFVGEIHLSENELSQMHASGEAIKKVIAESQI